MLKFYPTFFNPVMLPLLLPVFYWLVVYSALPEIVLTLSGLNSSATEIVIGYPMVTFVILRFLSAILTRVVDKLRTVPDTIRLYQSGYCYLILFQDMYRLSTMHALGPNPKAEHVLTQHGLEITACFTSYQSESNLIHVRKVESGGVDPITLLKQWQGYRVGNQGMLVPNLWCILGVQRLLRIALWVLLIFNFDVLPCIILGAIMAGMFWASLDIVVIGVVVVSYTLAESSNGLKLGVLVLWVLMNKVNYLLSVKWLRTKWNRPKFSFPEPGQYPEGIKSSGRAHTFTYHNRNRNYMRPDLPDDRDLTSDELKTFYEQTGLLNTGKERGTGNPHKLAAHVRRFWHWKAPDYLEEPEYIINIGGTFRTWGCTASGVSFQPSFSDSDRANQLRFPSKPGYGQLVVEDWLPTDCGPVGGGPREWDPNWTLSGLPGAPFWLIHVYDLPLKALLGCAHKNNSDYCFVVMQSSPAHLTEDRGELPWTKQCWKHLPNGNTKWWWREDSSGQVWEHNTRIHFEHLLTDYVCVTKGVWYVSDIYRRLMDTYLIRWTRTRIKPEPTTERQIALEYMHDYVRLPTADRRKNSIFEMSEINFISSVKTYEEYLHQSNDFESLMVYIRATTDGYMRNKGRKIPFLQHEEIVGLWHAELQRKGLSQIACPKGTLTEEAMNVLALFGLAPDNRFLRDVATEALRVLKGQPSTIAICKTIRQEEPYLDEDENEPPQKCKRRYPMFDGNTANPPNVVDQSTLDQKEPLHKIEMICKGKNLNEKIIHGIFGSLVGIGPILPLGDPAKGGSYLNPAGTKLLPTEFEYITTSLSFILILIDEEWDKNRYIGQILQPTQEGDATNIPRQGIVVLNLTTEKVYRVHYRKRTEALRIVDMYNAEFSDLVDNMDIINGFEGTPRGYIVPENDEQIFQTARCRVIHSLMKKTNRAADRDELREIMWTEEEEFFIRLEISQDIQGPEQVPLLIQDEYLIKYDGNNLLPNSEYPPPHHFADNVQMMRRLRR